MYFVPKGMRVYTTSGTDAPALHSWKARPYGKPIEAKAKVPYPNRNGEPMAAATGFASRQVLSRKVISNSFGNWFCSKAKSTAKAGL
jgi:hypothetical protein